MATTWRKVGPLSHEEWLEWRRQGVGASDAPAILGVSPWSTPYQTWRNKVFPREQKDNSSMKRGRDMEPIARAAFELKVGSFVYPENVENIEHPWLRASLDGLCKEGLIMVEIKCPNKLDHATAVSGHVPEKYWPQCQHQLAVTGFPSMYYWSFDGTKGAMVEVLRDEAFIVEQLFPKLQQFWYHVIDTVSPPLTEADLAILDHEEAWRTFTEMSSVAI